MKKPIILFLLMLFAAGSYAAEENRIVKPAENTQEDIYNALSLLGVNAYRFDLSSFADKEYSFDVYIDEYKDGKTEEVQRWEFGSNWRDPWEEGGETERQLAFKEMTIYSVERGDSTVIFNFDFHGMGSLSLTLTLYTFPDQKKPSYAGRKFIILPMEGKNAKIPLIFFSSFWWDEEYNIYRSCMENEINPDLSNEAISKIMHYYILGIEVSEI